MLRRWADLPRGTWWLAGGIAAAAVLALAFAWALFVPLADWLAHHDVGSATGALHETALDNARGRLLTLGAALFAAGALWFTARNFTLSREGQVTDRYAKAVEQLGSDKLDVRIGGIYALERIARDSARDHPVVMEVLAAFIREHSHEQWPLPDPDGSQRKRRTRPDILAVAITVPSPEPLPPPAAPGREQKGWTRPDVQAAMTVIGRRNQERDITGRPIDLTGANLTGADLAGADLTSASMFGADLSAARLRFAHLDGADLGGSDLTGVRLLGASLAAADLHGAVLAGAEVADASLYGADLGGANLTGASLYRANLTSAVLIHADLTGANLTGAALAHAQLDGAQLDGALWPREAEAPEGWEREAGTGRLQRTGNGSGPA